MNSAVLFRYLVLLSGSPLVVLILQTFLPRINQRVPSPLHPQLVGGIAVLLGYPVTGILAWWSFLRHQAPGLEQGVACLYGVLVYSSLAFSYIQLFNISETARRFHILYELKMNGKMSRDDLYQQYSPTEMLTTRLERLVSTRQLQRVEDRYVLDNKLLYFMAKLILGWTKLLQLPVKTGP